MGTRTWVWAMGMAASLAAASAQAQPWGRGDRERRGADERREPPAQLLAPREQLRRDEPPAPGPGRMSPEERRQLRRDIQDAGQNVYRREPPHRRF